MGKKFCFGCIEYVRCPVGVVCPPVRNGLWCNTGKPLNFLDDSLAVGKLVLEARPLLPGHPLNLLPGRLLHLLVPGQVEDTPGYNGFYGWAGRMKPR